MPAFDTVRVTPEGEALVAGRAAAGATVLLKLDGAEAMRAVADSQGNFVAMFTLPPSDQPRLLSLAEAGPPERLAEQTVALAPVAGPKVPEATAAAEAQPAEMQPAGAPQPEAPQALLITDQGAQVLQAPETMPETAAPGQVSVDAISYTPDGAVQLSGRAAAGAALRLYLDNAPLAEVLAAGTGQWFTTLRDVPPGLYTLRADQIGAEGKVTSRFETPFLRETPEALAAALKPQAIPGQPRALAPPAALSGQPAATPAVAPAATPAVAPAAPPPAIADAETPLSITVQPGFTLWRIARENFGDGVLYVKVFEANKTQIRDPDLIYPGQVFTIPKG
ncbi:MAG: LysM peptidoglycan-binding domain-containing protein [Gemmobacter sp.]|nr:LysM peptidoglycan-binding domain-containing protein [Gemmobacter sp.]